MSYTAIITIIAIILLLAVIALVYLLLKPQKSEEQIRAEIKKENIENQKTNIIEEIKEGPKNETNVNTIDVLGGGSGK
jgi:LPS O-antigen subunit length determinant protein (WzzB/FepE family)